MTRAKKIINLLPPERKEEMRYEYLAQLTFAFSLFVAFALVASYAVLLLGLGSLRSRAAMLQNDIRGAEERLAQFAQVEVRKLADELNAMLATFERVEGVRSKWSSLLEEFAKNVPTGVAITRLTFSEASKQVSLGGVARSREDMLQFRENILSSSAFRDINFPLSNLSYPIDIPFRYTFYVQEDTQR